MIFFIITTFIIDLAILYFTCRYLHIKNKALLRKNFIMILLNSFIVIFIPIYLPEDVRLFNNNLDNTNAIF